MTKKRISKTFSKSILTVGLALGFAAQVSNASILISFEQVGDDVVATTSGEILVGSSGLVTNFNSGDVLEGSFFSLLGIDGNLNAYDRITGAGVFSFSGLFENPDSFVGDSFGFSSEGLIWDPDVKEFEGLSDDFTSFTYSVSPNTTWTWENKTLGEIAFLGILTTTERVVYMDTSLSSADTISFVLVPVQVPEPSSSLMLALGGMGMLLRRRR